MPETSYKPVLDIDLPCTIIWQDEFDTNLSLWNQTDIADDALHRITNKGLKLDGSLDPDQKWSVVPGRHAALYDKHRDKCQFIRHEPDGTSHLVLKAHVVHEKNPYRDNFTDSTGKVHPYGDMMPYGGWLSSFGRKDGPDGQKITDPSKTSFTFGKGTVIEARANLSKMCMRNHRFSFWWMPTEKNAYDNDPSGRECDAPEIVNEIRVENSSLRNKGLFKMIGGEGGTTPNSEVDFSDHDIDITQGWHTFTTVWNHDGTTDFYCDAKLMNRDDQRTDMVAYLILSNEMASGVKEPRDDPREWENYSTGPYKPVDVGLTAQSVIEDIDMADDHEAWVDYVRAWRIDGEIDIDLDWNETLDEQVIRLQSLIDSVIANKDAQISSKDAQIAELKKSSVSTQASSTLASLIERLSKL